jgi:hypothetical protein
MVDITAIAGAMSSLKAFKDLAEAMIGLRDAEAFQQKRFELQAIVIDAQNSIFTLQEERTAAVKRIEELEQKIAAVEQWQTEKERYHLKAIEAGSFAYTLKREVAFTDVAHWLCANCYEQGKKSILQRTADRVYNRNDGELRSWRCAICTSEILVGPQNVP